MFYSLSLEGRTHQTQLGNKRDAMRYCDYIWNVQSASDLISLWTEKTKIYHSRDRSTWNSHVWDYAY